MRSGPPRQGSLRTKWTAALLLCGAAPLAVLTFATVRIQRRGLETAERQLEVAVIDHAAAGVLASLEEVAEATHRVGQLLTDARIGDQETRLTLARDAMARADLLAQVAIYGADGRFIDAIGRGGAAAPLPALPPPPQTVPALQRALAAPLAPPPGPSAPTATGNDGGWLTPIWPGGEGAPGGALLRYAEPVVRDGRPRAFVLGTVASSALSPRLEGISRDRFEGRPDGVLLVGGDLKVMAGGGQGALALGSSLAGVDLLSGVALAGGAFDRPYAVASEFRAAGSAPGTQGAAMVGSLRSLPELGVAVAVRRTREAAYGALEQARQLLLGAAALLALLAIGAGAWLAARTTAPVARLVDLTRAYARRDFARRSDVTTGDELEALGTAMGDMAGQLAASEKEIERRATVEADLSRYLPAPVARAIAEGQGSLALGGERRAVSVLFADVVAFTSFAEGAPPERVVGLLNELFSTLTEVVFRHGGTVDKFIGDCVMAVFGAPAAQADHAARALAAAEDMHRFVEAQAPAWKRRHGVLVRLGIGVNSGEAVVGNLGSATRMEYTAVGDMVNVAARLEGMARPGQTLLTRAVADQVGAAFRTASLGSHPIRGKELPIEVLELQG